MSALITMLAVRKRDCAPFGDFYLGGNGTRDAVECLYEPSETPYGGFVKLAPSDMLRFLMETEDEFYGGHNSKEAQEFIIENKEEFAFFICLNF